MAQDMRLGIKVDTDTRTTRTEFSNLARLVKDTARDMGVDYQTAADHIERSLEEAGTTVRGELLDSLRDIGRRGPTELDKIRDSIKDVRREADDPIDIDIDVDKATHGAGNLRERLKEEGGDSGREFAASFSGQASDVGDLGQEILANIGPVGVGAAVGLGLVTSLVSSYKQHLAERKEEINQAASGMFDVMRAEGVTAWADVSAAAKQAFYEQQLTAITQKESYSDVAGAAKALGVDVATVYAAMAGDTKSQTALEEAHNRKVADIQASVEGLGVSVEAKQAQVEGLTKSLDNQTGVITKYTGTWSAGMAEAQQETTAVGDALARIAGNSSQTVDVKVTAFGLEDVERRLAAITSGTHYATITYNTATGVARSTTGGQTAWP
ncbi:MAG: hypothetical protein FWF90_15635 [Promicromonosporaceae bacterium]|nr:hypothetical protein [Promicromonosporaceae bacterium]